MPEVHDLLQLLRIERPPLGAASTPSIRQCGNTANPKSCKPWAGLALTDPSFNGKLSAAPALVEMLPDQAFPNDAFQSGMGVWMHWV